jgi:hypothetical protein
MKAEMMKWLRLLYINGLVFFFCLGLLFLGGEAYYRFFYDTTDSFGLSRITTRWFQKYYRHNRLGFRDDIDYAMKRASGRRRISFIGDSFTAGHGVKDPDRRFANLIRKEKSEWEIHILASNGFDTGAEMALFEKAMHEGYELQDVVLVYCLNDIADIVPEWRTILERIYKQDRPGFWVKNSYLINMLYYRLKAIRDPDISRYYHFVGAAYEGTVWEAQQKRLKQWKEAIESHGGRLAVVTFPFLHAMGSSYEYQEIHEKLNRFWKETGVPHLDLLPVYQNYSAHQLTVNRFDAHPNEFAHALAAEKIRQFLENSGSPELS